MALLGHVSAEMSLRYGRLFDATVRAEYERALDLAKQHGSDPGHRPNQPAADRHHRRREDWKDTPLLKSRLAGGFCLRAPAQGACTYANICEHCPSFRADPAHCRSSPPNASTPKPSPTTPRTRGWISEAERHQQPHRPTRHLDRRGQPPDDQHPHPQPASNEPAPNSTTTDTPSPSPPSPTVTGLGRSHPLPRPHAPRRHRGTPPPQQRPRTLTGLTDEIATSAPPSRPSPTGSSTTRNNSDASKETGAPARPTDFHPVPGLPDAPISRLMPGQRPVRELVLGLQERAHSHPLLAHHGQRRRATFEYIESWLTFAGSTAPSATAARQPTKPPSTRTPPPRRHDLASTLSVEPGQPQFDVLVGPGVKAHADEDDAGLSEGSAATS